MKKLQLLTILALSTAMIQTEDVSQGDIQESPNEYSEETSYLQETPESTFALQIAEYLRMLQHGQMTEIDFNRTVNLKIGTYLNAFGSPEFTENTTNEYTTLPSEEFSAPVETNEYTTPPSEAPTIPVEPIAETGVIQPLIEDKPTNQEIEAL